MRQAAAVAVLAMLSVGPAFGQAAADAPVKAVVDAGRDSATLQEILVEIRGIHSDVRLSETTQILLTEMELQQGAVTRAQQKRDEVKLRLTQLDDQQKNSAIQIEQFEDQANAMTDPAQKKQLTQIAEQLKRQITMLKSQEPDRTNDLTDAEGRLRKEQDALAAIQEQLNAVVKKLQP